MPEPTIAIALVLLVALVEATPAVRIPLGLLLAIALLAADAELLPIALLGALGVMIARLAMALVARSGRDRLVGASPAANARRNALRDFLARSPAYTRTTFLLAALPGVPAGYVFPLLGAMRAPLAPALAGTIVGRVPVLAITAALFTWIARVSTESDEDAALLLGVLAILLFALRTVGRVDWQHRAETGRWRMRPEDDAFLRVTTTLTGAGEQRSRDWYAAATGRDDPRADDPDGDVVEGELLGEESDDEDVEPGPDDEDGGGPEQLRA